MLQRLLLITLTLCSLTASAQWQQTGSKVRYVNGLGIPTKDTAAGVAADSSQIVIRPADSSLYIKYKRTWVKVGSGISGSGTTNRVPKFTSSTAIGNSSIVDSASAVAMTINPSGNIGIGTASPGRILDVVKNQNAASQIILTNTDAGTSAAAQLLALTTGNRIASVQQYGSGVSGVVAGISAASLSVFESGLDASALLINKLGAFPIAFATNLTERMRILSDGNVGIGYTAPAAKLAVSGATLINTNTDNGVDKLQVSGSALVTEAFKAATTSGNVSLRTTVTTYPVNMTLGANSGIGFYEDGTSSTIIATNQTLSSTNILQFLGTQYIFAGTSSGKVTINTSSDNGVDELQVNGSISGIGFKQAYVTKTGAYTATNDDYVIDCTSGTFTVTLPASSGRTGRILIIKNSGAGTITVDGNSSETIDGAATYSIAVQYGTIQIMSDGTNWKIISKF